jgi:hypothetical protein
MREAINVSNSSQGRRQFIVGGLLSCVGLFSTAVLWPRYSFGQADSRTSQRMALVIGNGAYAFGRLKNPVNDAQEVARALQAIGFEVVALEDGNLSQILEAMKELIARGKESSVRLLFYAGHGIQSKGKNYLVPIDATQIDEDKLSTQLVNVNEFTDKLGLSGSGINIVILDACRTGLSQVAARRRGADAKRSLKSGLAQMSAPQGMVIAFSTAPGQVALDGPAEHSVYTPPSVRADWRAGTPRGAIVQAGTGFGRPGDATSSNPLGDEQPNGRFLLSTRCKRDLHVFGARGVVGAKIGIR